MEQLDRYLSLGDQALEDEEFADAANSFEAATKVESTNYRAWSGLAYAKLQLEEWPSVVAACRQAISLSPEKFAPHFNLGVALRAQSEKLWRKSALRRSFDPECVTLAEEAVVQLKEVVLLKPDCVEGYGELGNACKNLGEWTKNPEWYEQAVTAFKGCLEAGSDAPETYVLLSVTYSLLGRKRDEIDTLKTGLKHHPDDESLLGWLTLAEIA